QPRVRIESDNADRIGDKIRKRVHVVVELPPGSLIEDTLDAADFHSCKLYDAFDVFDDLRRRFVAFHFHARFWSIHRAGNARQLFAPRVLANVCGTQIEALARNVNSNGVKIFAAEDLDARDDSIAGGEGFLHEGGRIDSEVQSIFFDGGAQLVMRAKPFNSC